MAIPGADETDMAGLARALGASVAYSAGEPVFREGDPARHMFVVLRGLVSIASRGREIATLEPGDALGIVSLIDGHTRSTDARAQTDVELAVVDAAAFRRAVEEVPRFAWYVMEELARRLRAANAAL